MKKLPFLLVKTFLYPFSLVYGMITAFRNCLFNWGIIEQQEFDVPLICVGNLAVGGTGKTPHVEFLIRCLSQKYKVAVLSRGYKRKTFGFVLADEHSTHHTIGDEPFQMKQKFQDIIIAVDANRRRGIQLLIDKYQPDVILLDDAFQHRHVKPGLSILLTDYNNLFVKDHMLPYGKLRESSRNKKRADIVIVSKCPDEIKPIDFLVVKKDLDLSAYQELYFSGFEYEALKPVFAQSIQHPIKQQDVQELNASILLVTGIVSPFQLEQYLMDFTQNIISIAYPDHHSFSQKDIATIALTFEKIKTENKIIVVTEKDAARLVNMNLPEELKKALYSIGIKVKMLQEKEQELTEKIINYVRKNKRNR